MITSRMRRIVVLCAIAMLVLLALFSLIIFRNKEIPEGHRLSFLFFVFIIVSVLLVNRTMPDK